MLAKGTFNEDDIAPITNRSIRLVLECSSPFTAISHEQLTLPTHRNGNRFCDISLDLDWNQCGQPTMSNSEFYLLSPTRILPYMTPPISLTIATTRS